MSKPWKLKTNSSNILLVLITLLQIKAECCEGKGSGAWEHNTVDGYDYYHEQPGNSLNDEIQIYVGHDKIAQFYFNSIKNNNFLILYNINKCLENFNIVTCLKLFLLENINSFRGVLNKLNDERKDVILFNGLLTFKMKSDVGDDDGDDDVRLAKDGGDGGDARDDCDDDNNDLSLDEEISHKILKIFQKRLLRVNLNSKVKMDIRPVLKDDGAEKNICFSYKFVEEPQSGLDGVEEGRKKKKRFPMMMLPQLLMLGFLPFTIASLKAMVMNAMMINMMALNGAIFMLVRDIVFGPRPNSNLQYVNYGYSKDRQKQRKRPVLIIHSSAAFVKQPKVHYSKQASGSSSHFHGTNYVENVDAFHHNYEHSFSKKNDFSPFTLQGGHDSENQHKFREIHGVDGFNKFNTAGFQRVKESFVENSDDQTRKSDVYFKNSLNYRIDNNRINNNNNNNNYFVEDNIISNNNNYYYVDHNKTNSNSYYYVEHNKINSNNYIADHNKINNNNIPEHNKINNNNYIAEQKINNNYFSEHNKINNNNYIDEYNKLNNNYLAEHIKINNNNYIVKDDNINNKNYAVGNNSYQAKQNQRTLRLKSNINNRSSYETKPKFRYSSKISSIPLISSGVQESHVSQAKDTLQSARFLKRR